MFQNEFEYGFDFDFQNIFCFIFICEGVWEDTLVYMNYKFPPIMIFVITLFNKISSWFLGINICLIS